MRKLLIAAVSMVLAAGACSSGGSRADEPDPTSTTTAPATVEARATAGCGTPVATGETRETLSAGDAERWYFRRIPPGYDGSEPLPLVLDLHGYSEGATVHLQMSDLGAYGDEVGFVTVTPQGSGAVPMWDTTLGSDDLEFVGDLLDTLEADLCLDANRVYVTGLSNGAFMTSAIACQYGDRVAAVAPVAGARGIEGCEFSRPVPVVAFHGTADGFVAYDGGLGEAALDLPAPDGSGRTLRDLATSEDLEAERGGDSVPTIMEAWAERNGCRTATTERAVTPEVTEIAFRCPVDASTMLYRIAGGGHTWPGSGFSDSIASIVGPTNMDVSANEIMWSFFQDHPLRTG